LPALENAAGEESRARFALWGRGFRPFFLLAGGYGCGFVLLWLAILQGLLAAPTWLAPTLWHAHEMVFGFVAAAIAGFLLTSVPVWTGSRPVSGPRLATLAGLWLLGRFAMTFAGWIPPLVVALADLAFLPALALSLAPALYTAGQWRNAGFVGILSALTAANLAIQLQNLGLTQGGAAAGLRLAVDLVIVLVVLVGGRITPAFTANALRQAGIEAPLRRAFGWIDRLTLLAVVGFASIDLVAPRSPASGAVALLAALALAARMSGWQSLRTGFEPLLWSLHLGYAWVVVGLAALALGDLFGVVAWTSGVHALTTGAFGTMILAVMTRVGLGHTGRPLALPRGTPLAYALVTGAAIVRFTGPLVWPELASTSILVSGVLWSAAFGLFTIVYFPILTRPRVDGRPG
jgi:uncharacterized protein involved in response to NO